MTPDSSRSPLASGVRSLLIGAGALSAIVAVSLAAAALLRVRPFPAGARPSARAAASNSGLGLRAEVRGGSLQVRWNHDAAPVRNATSGSLTVQDGEVRRTLQLNQTTARAGSIFYAARGTQVQVALTIFGPEHVVSESISATVPAAAAQPALPPASEAGPEVLVPSGDSEIVAASPEAECPVRAGQSTSARHAAAGGTPRASQSGFPNHGLSAGNSAPLISPREEHVATPSASDVAASDSAPTVLPGTVAIRVEVDGAGKVVNAVLVPQHDADPAFVEAALEMARDWRFEASPAGNQHTTRILEFRPPANR